MDSPSQNLRIKLLISVGMLSLVLQFQTVFGQSFEAPINLTSVTHGAECQSIKVSGNNVYVAWSDHAIGGGDILFRRSVDGGSNFGITQDLSSSTGHSACPKIAVTESNVYVVWNEQGSDIGTFDVFFRKSSNGGETFGPIKNISHNSGDSSFPSIASLGTRVYLAWDDDTLPGDFMTFFSRSPDSGTSFGPVKNLVKPPINEALNAEVAVSGHTVYVVWTGNAGDLNQVYMRVSDDGGNNFGSTKNISNNKVDSGRASLRASENNVYIAWQSQVQGGNEDIIFRKSTNKGSSFDSPVNISDNPSRSLDPLVSISGNTVYIVWTDGEPNSDILFRRSINKGTAFDPLKNLSNNSGESSDPFLTKDGSNIQVSWQDHLTSKW